MSDEMQTAMVAPSRIPVEFYWRVKSWLRRTFTKNMYHRKFLHEYKILEKLHGEDLTIRNYKKLIIKACKIMSKEGHSGTSAAYYSNSLAVTLRHVLRFEPLSPLQGDDDEWTEVDMNLGFKNVQQQNRRLSSVFKDENGPSYLNAIVFQGPDDWDSFTGTCDGVKSSQKLKGFPFTAKTFFIDVTRKKVKEEEALDSDTRCGDGTYRYKIKNRNQLKAVKEYYDYEEKVNE